jgi:uncharacterized tellurite resistance protein B-like protein|tara:strand:- start:162 stop:587 length:426 start_codon:yes stop_codon:yes gene_type:complete
MGHYDKTFKLTKKEKETVVSNMWAVMHADEKLHLKEKIWFERTACRVLGFTHEEAQELVCKLQENPESIKFTPAKDDEGRIGQLIPVVHMMMSDGVIDDREMEICRIYADKLGFEPYLGDRVSAAVETIKKFQKMGINPFA